MILPQDFILTTHNTFGQRGRTWLAALPDLIAQASRRWDLTDIQPIADLSYNFVAFAKRNIWRKHIQNQKTLKVSTANPRFVEQGGHAIKSAIKGRKPLGSDNNEEVVLKIGVPDRELASEMTALRLFNGAGAVRLLEADPERYMFLLEHIRPGEMLATLPDDEQAMHIAADVMLNLWRPAPSDKTLIKLSDWFAGFQRLRSRFQGDTGPLDRNLVEQAETAAVNFFAEAYEPTLIHGDLHHFNILSSARGWLAIDPKGVIGPAAYELGPLLINPLGAFQAAGDIGLTKKKMAKRIDILSERLGFEHERIRLWGLAHSVLSAWWSVEDNGEWKYAMHCAEIFAQL